VQINFGTHFRTYTVDTETDINGKRVIRAEQKGARIWTIVQLSLSWKVFGELLATLDGHGWRAFS
jgi:hypothetical protein